MAPAKVYLCWHHIDKSKLSQNWTTAQGIHWPIKHEVREWIDRNCQTYHVLCDDNGTDLNLMKYRRGLTPFEWSRPYILFFNPEDALMFKLTWV